MQKMVKRSGTMVVVMALIFMVLVWNAAWATEPVQEGGVKGLSERVEQVESALEMMGITLSGVIEVEAAYTDDDREDGDTSDITLATVELGVDIKPVKHVSGHILFLFEEDDTEPVEVDQGFIRLDGEDKLPLFLQAGRQYVPFGYFESHFISDPLTLELGETRESSVVAGYSSDIFEFSLGVFNGDVEETGENDDHIDGYVASATYTLPGENAVGLVAGVSYISNIGESDNLEGEDGIDVDADNTIDDHVPGVAAFISANYKEKVFLELEYVTATDEFEAGELAFDGGMEAQPSAYNVELTYLFTDRLEAGVRVGGADDAGDFLPETLYGAIVNYALFENLSLGLEYQYGEFDTADDDDITTVTAQLALEF